MQTPESKVKAKVREILKAHGAYYFTPVGSAFGQSGIPDIIACLNGRFIGIECKAGKNTLSALQAMNLANIFASGGVALVINENNLKELSSCLSYVMTLPSVSGYGNFVMRKVRP